MSLLNLKSIFSPTNTKFQDNQSDLSTFPRQFDNNFQQSNLLELNRGPYQFISSPFFEILN